ncbi:hypothetical protein [Thermoactinospora rubra]|uniref:hypothetical protein n=1 Tax=Thermoactinospora rubra TaxID=1088767 RepID=UPI000A0FC334|nr:hypothetical protein [Thermoactinospora rubra]
MAVASAAHQAHLPPQGAGLAVGIPVALYVLSVWALHARRCGPAFPAAAVVVAGVSLLGFAVPLIGLVMAGLVAVTAVWASPR